MKTAQVIGGGFTGTLAAYFLVKRGYQVRLIDNQPKLGGLIQTLPHPFGDIETAANGFMSNSLIEGIADEIGAELVPASSLAKKNRWLWVDGHAQRWPLSILETLGFGLRVLWGFLTQSMAPRKQESLEHWGLRTLGGPATRKILSTAMLGIYASPISELSASLVVGRFFEKSSRPKKPRARLRGTVAPKRGMGEWFEKMHAYL
ncbi:hypothetical protein EBZ37_14165, partial [bacterium]|nr:hypothetical protein [bacterium]